jgi:hypothetical protein
MSVILAIWEAEIGDWEDHGSRPAKGKSSQDPVSTNKICMW